MAQITYDDKVALNENPSVAEINKVTDDNMNEIKDTINTNTPVGSISLFAGTTAPNGWLICDGSAVSRTTYANLFSVIGTTYGTGDGSTTFNIPDLQGRVPVGYKSSDTSFDTIGETGGSKELQSHNHDIRYQNPNGSGVTISHTDSGLQTLDITNWSWQRNTANSKGSGSNLFTNTEGTGNSGNLQPYIVMNYIISY